MLRWVWGVSGGTVYGLSVYLAANYGALVGVLSLAFLCVVPIIIGALTVILAPKTAKTSFAYGIVMPVVALFPFLAIVLILQFELIICVVMALPVIAPLAIAGGLTMVTLFRDRANDEAVSRNQFQKRTLSILLLPLLVLGVERQFEPPQGIYHVRSQRVIQADAETVWTTLLSVPEIDADEFDYTFYHRLGIPRPVEAVMEGEGVGAVRYARYDNGLTLQEPVTVWEPNRRFVFEIIVDKDAPKPYHMVGSEFFDVIEVGFTIEPLADGSVRLHLTSTYRLSTIFKDYGRYWVDDVLDDLQNYILDVIERRAEAVTRGSQNSFGIIG